MGRTPAEGVGAGSFDPVRFDSNVGIAAYTLGGGVGFYHRKHGLACNRVTAIELVTAGGEQIRVDAVNEPDLFWAPRGGGGSFGVVTALEFGLLPLPEIFAGALLFPAEPASEVLQGWNRDRGPAACPRR